MTEKDFIDYVLDKNGFQLQAMVCMEEMAELTKELSKFARGIGNRENIAEEIADVILCIREMCVVFKIDNLEIEQRIRDKENRYLGIKSNLQKNFKRKRVKAQNDDKGN